jgi:hypothetical protein
MFAWVAIKLCARVCACVCVFQYQAHTLFVCAQLIFDIYYALRHAPTYAKYKFACVCVQHEQWLETVVSNVMQVDTLPFCLFLPFLNRNTFSLLFLLARAFIFLRCINHSSVIIVTALKCCILYYMLICSYKHEHTHILIGITERFNKRVGHISMPWVLYVTLSL